MRKKTAANHPKEMHEPFTLRDARLLEQCIGALQALDQGRRTPQTPAQEQFLRVCRRKLAPSTEYEKAYIRWKTKKPDIRTMLMRADSAQRMYNSLNRQEGSRNVNEDDRTLDEVIKAEKERQRRVAEKRQQEPPKSDFKPLHIDEPWGSREAWKRDRARNKYNGR